MAEKIKALKSGKVSVTIPENMVQTFKSLTEFKLFEHRGQDDLRAEIFSDIRAKIQDNPNRIKLSKIEFICLFEKQSFQGIPESVQALFYSYYKFPDQLQLK